MLILAIADLHGPASALARVPAMAAEADLVLAAGDHIDFGGAQEARKLLALLEGAEGKIALVPGNCGKSGARAVLEDRRISADGRLVAAAGAMIIGAGGSPRRSVMTPYERSDGESSEALALALEACEGEGSSRPLIVLTHAPPKGSGAERRKGVDVGSPALRGALDRIGLPL